jgi:hypothetical protein
MISPIRPLVTVEPQLPHPQHWKLLSEKDQQLLLEPAEFLARWAVTRHQLARICRCSPSLVSSWLTECGYHREPGEEYKLRLGFVNLLWSNLNKRK